jgi:hypothetical protein
MHAADFPTKERIVGELKTHEYDEIGISSIMTNLLKVRWTCKLIRKHQPHVTIVVGGHIANLFTFLLSASGRYGPGRSHGLQLCRFYFCWRRFW